MCPPPPTRTLRNQEAEPRACTPRTESGCLCFVSSYRQAIRFPSSRSVRLPKAFESLPSLWKKLNFVQDDERLSTIQLRLVLKLKLSKEAIQIAQTVDKQIFDNLVCLVKTNQDVALVGFASQLLRKRCLAYTSGTFEEQGVVRRVLLLSLEHFLENFSLEYHRKTSFHKCAPTYRLILHNCAIELTKKACGDLKTLLLEVSAGC